MKTETLRRLIGGELGEHGSPGQQATTAAMGAAIGAGIAGAKASSDAPAAQEPRR